MCRKNVVPGSTRAIRILILLVSVALLGVLPGHSQAPTGSKLGGSLYWETPGGRLPATGIGVTLVRFDPRDHAARVSTDLQGWYVFYNVPKGEYFLLLTLPDGRIFRTVLISVPNSGELTLNPMKLP